MKKHIYLCLLLAFIVSACGKEDKKLEAFNPEAFALSLEPGWELNSTVRVKGVTEEQDGDIYRVQLSYTIDLAGPNGLLQKNIDTGELKEANNEEFTDVGLESQIELDSTYTAGKYKILFNIKDDISGQTAKAEKEFELTNE